MSLQVKQPKFIIGATCNVGVHSAFVLGAEHRRALLVVISHAGSRCLVTAVTERHATRTEASNKSPLALVGVELGSLELRSRYLLPIVLRKRTLLV